MFLVLSPCTFPNFILKPNLLFCWHTRVAFDDRNLWLFLPTWLWMGNPVTTGSDDLTFLGSILQELGFVQTSNSWTLVHGFSWYYCSFCHWKSKKVYSVNLSFAFLPQWLEGMSSISRISRRVARCKSPIFAFLDFPFIVLSNTAQQGVNFFIIWRPDSHFNFQVDMESFKIYKVAYFEFIRRSCNFMLTEAFVCW